MAETLSAEFGKVSVTEDESDGGGSPPPANPPEDEKVLYVSQCTLCAQPLCIYSVATGLSVSLASRDKPSGARCCGAEATREEHRQDCQGSGAEARRQQVLQGEGMEEGHPEVPPWTAPCEGNIGGLPGSWPGAHDGWLKTDV